MEVFGAGGSSCWDDKSGRWGAKVLLLLAVEVDNIVYLIDDLLYFKSQLNMFEIYNYYPSELEKKKCLVTL